VIDEVARAALKAFPHEKVEIMVAIAGAESAYRLDARGDALASFAPEAQLKYEAMAWGGYLSFGPWQIFLGVHSQRVARLSGLSSQGALAIWLFDADNCAKVAAEILAEQGLEAWSTYSNGQYLQFEIEASAAVARADNSNAERPSKEIAAVSFSGSAVHLDRADGSFEERRVIESHVFGPWLRFDLD